MLPLFIVLGSLFLLLGIFAMLFPDRFRSTERRVSPKSLDAGVETGRWAGRLQTRSRFVGFFFILGGAVLLAFGIVGR